MSRYKKIKVALQNSDKKLLDVKTINEKLQNENQKLKSINQNLRIKVHNLEIKNDVTQKENNSLKSKEFSYANLVKQPKMFKYLCGLNIEQFNLLFTCVQPYFELIVYPDCSGTGKRKLSKETELLCMLTISHHALHSGVMAYILNINEATVNRNFTAWVVFLESIFSEINLKPDGQFLAKKMPEIFIKTGHGLTDIVLDCTEFKFQQPSNYELNTLMFSNYKNTITGKALVGITPHGMGIFFSDIYPGSISDSDLTEKSGVAHFVRPEHEIMADRGFSIQDLCAVKGVYLNRPAQKSQPQFNEAEVANNFDIAATRIHVERFIGRVRNWTILNATWPINRMDLLSSTWQTFCHIVNLTMPPIGPKLKKKK